MSLLFDTNKSRKETIALIKSSLPENQWIENQITVNNIRQTINQHQLFINPCLKSLYEKKLPLPLVQFLHIEYQHSIVEIFTDALIKTQFEAKQLDALLFPAVKMYARFLINFNILDEFGFTTEADTPDSIITPQNAHYLLYRTVIDEIGISKSTLQNWQYTKQSIDVRNYLEKNYDNYAVLLILLAVAEQQVIVFSPALKATVDYHDLDTTHGYYFVHGVTTDTFNIASDDLHEDDLWLLLMQCIHLFPTIDFASIALTYCDLWDSYWTRMNKEIEITIPT